INIYAIPYPMPLPLIPTSPWVVCSGGYLLIMSSQCSPASGFTNAITIEGFSITIPVRTIKSC
ncbi:MAG: hypothetical protein MUP55_03820, partial [Candidatus Aenigmarchaeota archaeon]|nr:hypothetical protein [Candidatus Aenigmarchaeota archaeon]